MNPENHEHSPEDDALKERREDQGVWNGAMGETYIHGFYPETPQPAERSKRPRVNRRGGRSYEEISGRDVAREIANREAAEHPLTPEEQENQREVNRRGIAMARRAIADAQIAGIVARAKAEEDPNPYDWSNQDRQTELAINARIRNYFDKNK